MKRDLLICPSCEEKGIKNVLAEFNENKSIMILRHHNNYTLIHSKEYKVECNKCGEIVMQRIKK